MTERTWIAGVGMTPFAVHPELSGHDLARWAVREALADAGDANVGDIDIAFYGNITDGALQGQHTIPGQIALRGMGLQTVPVYNVENACATGSTALNLATMAVRSGEADVALAVGAEKMNIDDRARTMALFDSGYDVSDPEALVRILKELGGAVDDSDLGTRSIFMDLYAAWTRNHMRLFGTTQEHGQFASSFPKADESRGGVVGTSAVVPAHRSDVRAHDGRRCGCRRVQRRGPRQAGCGPAGRDPGLDHRLGERS